MIIRRDKTFKSRNDAEAEDEKSLTIMFDFMCCAVVKDLQIKSKRDKKWNKQD